MSLREHHMIRVLCITTLLLLGLQRPAHAEPDAQGTRILAAHDVPLVVVGNPGFVRLSSCIMVVKLSCNGPQCALAVEQTYQIHNRDRIKEAALRIGLPAKVNGEAVPAPEAALRDAQGAALPAAGANAQYAALWELRLGRDERRTVVLAYTRPLNTKHLLRWRWEMALLSSWGAVESARTEFVLPGYITDDAFWVLEPRDLSFSGATLRWEYENLQSAPRYDLVMLSPNTWRQLRELRTNGAHRELARLYQAIDEESQREKMPVADHLDEITAELMAALESDPNDAQTRLDLAQVYQTRATRSPQLRLNYLVLAAQELALVLQQHPGDSNIASALSRAYYEAALTASEGGDPAGALAYLKKAGEVPGGQPLQEREKREELSLRWALNLAQQGLVSEALTQIQDVLSPQTQDALMRYAPPLVSAHTEVTLGDAERIVQYELRLYLPARQRTWPRLQALAARLNSVAGCQSSVQLQENLATLTVRAPYRSVAELKQRCAALVAVFAADEDTLSALIAAPWHLDLRLHTTQRGLWLDRYLYREHVDLTLPQTVWATESQYTRWRLEELRSTPPANARAQLEQRLGLFALTEQSQIWEQLPTASYWVYRLAHDSEFAGAGGASWLLPWGRTRDLEVNQVLYRWPRVVILLLAVAGGLIVLFALGQSARRARGRPSE